MQILYKICLYLCVTCLLAQHYAIAEKTAGWQAGAAKSIVTPKQYMNMSGYAGRDKPAEGKLTDLWAKALVIKDAAGQKAVVVTLDLIGLERSITQAICKALKQKFGFARSEIALCTSHTHTGPVVGTNLATMHYALFNEQQRALVDEYAQFLEEQIVAVVGEANDSLAAARLSWGSGKCTFAVNRRNNRAADVPKLRAAGELKGPSDHDVPVLAVYDADDQLKAVLFGYACHCTVLSFNQWSGDYAGFAHRELDKRHPGCVSLFWAGCGGDQNPLPRREVRLAKEYGEQLAAAVDEVLASEMKPVAAELNTSYAEIDLPLDTLPTKAQLETDAQNKNRFIASRAKILLNKLEKQGQLSQTYPYPIQVWAIGKEINFIVLGGEVVVDYAIRLKTELAGNRTWVAGYANDVMAYIPSRRVLKEGGYEGDRSMIYYGLPTTWAPELEEMIIKEVHRQVKSLSE